MSVPIRLEMSTEERLALLERCFVTTWMNKSAAKRFSIKVPLRICPLGAHSDHQKGCVTGLTIDRSVQLYGVVNEEPEVELVSTNFQESRRFSLSKIPAKVQGDWGNYARGAARALVGQGKELRRGFSAVIHGAMPIGGLSSSAAVTIAYLKALEYANGLSLSILDTVDLVRATENGYLGLLNGILDQSVILSGRKGALASIDCASNEMTTLAQDSSASPWEIVVVYSGLSRQLTATPFNQRVAECRQAARELLTMAGQRASEASVLGDVSPGVFAEFEKALPRNLQLRARHFFSEMERVREGREAWVAGDMRRFGELVTASGASSISYFESGSPALISLYEILSGMPGVYGTRFCGGGFQGCCLALVDPRRRDAIAGGLHEAYVTKHPELAELYSIHFCESADSVSVQVYS